MRPRYYQPSGAAPPAGILAGLGLGLAAGLVLALVYAYLIVYVPLVGYVTFLFAAAFGAGIGLATAYGLKLGKVRSRGVSIFIAVVAAMLAYAASWAFWVAALMRHADVDVGVFYFVDKPGELVDMIEAINEAGSWSLKSWTPTGGVLWFLWVLEAVIVLGVAVAVGVGIAVGSAFCERCQRWCTDDEDVVHLDDATPSEQVVRLTEARDWDGLAALGHPSHPTGFYRLSLSRCESCDEMHLLSAQRARIKIDKEGDESEETDDLVTRMYVTAGDAERLRALVPASPGPDAGA